MNLAVTVLGSAGMFATAERACSGYLLEIDDLHLWLDAGAGTWQKLLQQISYRDLDGIMLTHRHPDHTSDLFMALHARQFGEAGPLARIPLWAPQETLDALCAFDSSLEDAFELWAIADGGSTVIGGATFSFVAMAHPAETLGIRVEHDGKIFAYSADTGPEADFERLAGSADLFLCEATLRGAERWDGHLNAGEAKGIAERVGARRLLLTHTPPEHAPETVALDGLGTAALELGLATEGQRVEV